MNEQLQLEVGKVITTLAHRYARRCWWVDERDLQQEGWVTALEVQLKYQPKTIDHARALTWTATAFTMNRHLWWASAPVSTGRPNRKRLQGLQATALADHDYVAEVASPEVVLQTGAAESLLCDLRSQLRARATRLFFTQPQLLDGVLDVLLEGRLPKRVAVARAVPLPALYWQTKRCKQILIKDSRAVQILSDIFEQTNL
jgi:hypothetical protein